MKTETDSLKAASRKFALVLCLLLLAFASQWLPTSSSALAQKSSGQAKTPKARPAPKPKATQTSANTKKQAEAEKSIPMDVMMRIVRAEDERRWDNDLGVLLFDKTARIRERAALAAGRIGDERSVASLISLLQTDKDESVRARAAFALGETESPLAAPALVEALQKGKETSAVRMRAVEALGKISPNIPKTDEAGGRSASDAIVRTLEDELQLGTKGSREVVLEGLTAVLRARPAQGGAVAARFLASADARVRADAANTLARLRAKDGSEKLRVLLATDSNPIVRANAARALGAAEDAASLGALASRVQADEDERVRVSAIRSLALLKDGRAAAALLQRAGALMPAYRAAKTSADAHPHEANELLEIGVALGRVLANTNDERALAWLRAFREIEMTAPEVEIAFVRIAPFAYLKETPFSKSNDAERAAFMKNWRRVAAVAQGLSEVANITAAAAGSGIVGLQADAQITLRSWLDDPNLPAQATPDVLRALAAFKANDLAPVLRKQMSAKDVIVRATAAELLGELQPDEATARVLAESLPVAARDELNDAVLSILDSLAKQKTTTANDAIKTLLDSTDHLVRRRAVALLKANGAGDFSQRIATIKPRYTAEDYNRALARLGKSVRAVVNTDKGAFTIELLADDAPLNVDNFVELARKNYFNGISFHRVVPNFVIQGGDPRGDGNGGPGYQIRCEINEVEYERGAVGMALSGKDTGGSQWFVTHSPQPHLDGGYTVFGRVTSGMDVVDRIARGDLIRSITVTESARGVSKNGKTTQDAKRKRT